MNMFDQILAIRKFRQQQAELAFASQCLRRAEAEQHKDMAQKTLEKFRQWAASQEQILYQGLCGRVVRAREIENVLFEVSRMKKDEDHFRTAVHKANDMLEQETKRLGARRQAHHQAVRMTNKFS